MRYTPLSARGRGNLGLRVLSSSSRIVNGPIQSTIATTFLIVLLRYADFEIDGCRVVLALHVCRFSALPIDLQGISLFQNWGLTTHGLFSRIKTADINEEILDIAPEGMSA